MRCAPRRRRWARVSPRNDRPAPPCASAAGTRRRRSRASRARSPVSRRGACRRPGSARSPLRAPEEPEVDLGALDNETASLRSKLEAMGPVNLLAIQEFQELEERHVFFEKQETDLNDAIESLKDTIRRINRTSRERFIEAFE